MSNEWLFVLSALTDILFVFFAARRGVELLLSTVAINLVLIAIFGAKLFTVFGLTTNVGNIFYACVFLATYFLLERGGHRLGVKAIWYGAAIVCFFALLSQFAAYFTGLTTSEGINSAVTTLFSFSPRVAFASVLAYIFAQSINIFIFERLKARTKGKALWLRSIAANIVAQLVDSLIFFSIVFFDLSGPLLVQTILSGWLIKSFVTILGTPLLYLDAYFERKKA